MERIKSFILDLAWRIIARLLPAKPYLSLKFRVVFKRRMPWENPSTFCEKLQWMKLYDFHPQYVDLVDKIRVRKYVESKIGSSYVVPLLGVWSSSSEIDFDALPDRFVMKCNHDSGKVIVCRDKKLLDETEARRQMDRELRKNYYLVGRETPYKYVERKVFAEELLLPSDGSELIDYKFFCFNGKPEFLKINFNKNVDFRANYYDLDFNLLPFGEVWPSPDPGVNFSAPVNFQKMVEIAGKLSQGLPFARIDLYNVDGHIYFGEITLYPTSGFGPFNDAEWDKKLGDMIILPDNKKANA